MITGNSRAASAEAPEPHSRFGASVASLLRVPRCRDFDEDCDEVPDKVHCYLYDPAKGMCPYLTKG